VIRLTLAGRWWSGEAAHQRPRESRQGIDRHRPVSETPQDLGDFSHTPNGETGEEEVFPRHRSTFLAEVTEDLNDLDFR